MYMLAYTYRVYIFIYLYLSTYGTVRDIDKLIEYKDFDEVKNACLSAIDLGYRHFDTASCYRTERSLGAALNQRIQEGVIKREDLFVTTKLFLDSHRQEAVVPALKKSLSELKLEYVDLYLIHGPISFQPGTIVDVLDPFNSFTKDDPESDITKTWKGMEECVKLGLTRSIGISNFNKRQVQNILDHCQIKPACNQVEVHMFLQNTKLVDFCTSLGIQVGCYSPLGSLSLTGPGGILGDNFPNILKDEIMADMATKYNKTTAQIALRYQIQRHLVVIPKSSNPERQKSNLQVFDFDISQEDMNILTTLEQNARVFGSSCTESVNFPFNDEF